MGASEGCRRVGRGAWQVPAQGANGPRVRMAGPKNCARVRAGRPTNDERPSVCAGQGAVRCRMCASEQTSGRSRSRAGFLRPVRARGYIIGASQGLRFAASLGLVLGARWAVGIGGMLVGRQGREGLATVAAAWEGEGFGIEVTGGTPVPLCLVRGYGWDACATLLAMSETRPGRPCYGGGISR